MVRYLSPKSRDRIENWFFWFNFLLAIATFISFVFLFTYCKTGWRLDDEPFDGYYWDTFMVPLGYFVGVALGIFTTEFIVGLGYDMKYVKH